jgi:hypothetical protein
MCFLKYDLLNINGVLFQLTGNENRQLRKVDRLTTERRRLHLSLYLRHENQDWHKGVLLSIGVRLTECLHLHLRLHLHLCLHLHLSLCHCIRLSLERVHCVELPLFISRI